MRDIGINPIGLYQNLGVHNIDPQYVTFFDHPTETGMLWSGDTADYTLGVVFSFDVDGYVDAVIIYKPEGSTQVVRSCGVFTTDGTLLQRGAIELSTESVGPAYIKVPLSNPVPITAGQTLVFAATVIDGFYAATANYFQNDVVRGHITAPASGSVSGNGRFNDSSANLLYPNSSFNNANYWVDVRFFPEKEAPSGIPSGYPNSSNTGTSGVLTEYSGPTTISANDTIIEDMEINSSLTITGSNVVIRNCLITNFSLNYGIDAETAVGLTVEQCTITGPGIAGLANAAILGSGTFVGNNISQCENGIVLTTGSSTVTDNYIHDLNNAGASPHYDGITAQGGQDGVLIQHNTVVGKDTSDIFIKSDSAGIANVTINDNLLLGDPGFMFYVEEGLGGTIDGETIVITNNKMILGGSAYASISVTGVVLTGNVNAYSRLPI